MLMKYPRISYHNIILIGQVWDGALKL